jgi:hypothetical protein
MTEFGDRIKALREKNGWNQSDAALKIFPKTHATTTRGARTSHISSIETGRAAMTLSSPDFPGVSQLLGVSEERLKGMIAEVHRSMRARKTAAASAKPSPSIQAAIAAAAVHLPQAANPSEPVRRKPGRPRKNPVVAVGQVERVIVSRPAPSAAQRAEVGVDAIAEELTSLFQKSSTSVAIRNVHAEVLSGFVRRVVNAACKVQGSLS